MDNNVDLSTLKSLIPVSSIHDPIIDTDQYRTRLNVDKDYALYNLAFDSKFSYQASYTLARGTTPTSSAQTNLIKPGPTGNPSIDKVQAVINNYCPNGAPVTAQDFITVSQQTGVPIDLMLSQAIQESTIGTKGRGARTNNIFNVGNVDNGSNRTMSSWQTGIYNYAQLIKNNYAPDPNNITAESVILPQFIARRGPNTGSRYASDPNYENELIGILNSVRKLLT